MTLLKMSGYDVNFIFTPIHEAIYFESQESLMTKALKQVEDELIGFADALNFDIYGSYNPKEVGCNKSEYYDDTHLKYSCIVKIKILKSNPL